MKGIRRKSAEFDSSSKATDLSKLWTSSFAKFDDSDVQKREFESLARRKI